MALMEITIDQTKQQFHPCTDPNSAAWLRSLDSPNKWLVFLGQNHPIQRHSNTLMNLCVEAKPDCFASIELR